MQFPTCGYGVNILIVRALVTCLYLIRADQNSLYGLVAQKAYKSIDVFQTILCFEHFPAKYHGYTEPCSNCFVYEQLADSLTKYGHMRSLNSF